MKKLIKIIATVLLCILMLPIVVAQQAQQTTTIDPGTTPDSFLWGLDKALDNIVLLLTFDKGNKARKGLEIAQERLLEVKAMVEENKLAEAEKAQEEHGKILVKVKQNIKDIEQDDSLQEIEKVIQIEKELEEHDEDVEHTLGELKVKIEIKGEITQQQKDLINSILDSLKGQIGEVEIEIENKKNKIKIEIEQETGKSEQEIEVEIENMEKRKGVKKQEKALDAISDAEEELNEFLKEAKEKGRVVSPEVLGQFNALLEQARSKFDEGNFIEVRKLAKQAENLLDEEESEEEEREIEVEIEEGKTKVKVEIGEEELKFQLDTTDLDAIVGEISARTGLSLEEINTILKIEIGEEKLEKSPAKKETEESREDGDATEAGKKGERDSDFGNGDSAEGDSSGDSNGGSSGSSGSGNSGDGGSSGNGDDD